MRSTKEGMKLSELIRKAIDDLELTTSEYEEILRTAGEDSVIDAHEKQLLSQLQEMIANGTIKRVPG
jgi:hydroxylamine reductase (hybrid-cluster protein)